MVINNPTCQLGVEPNIKRRHGQAKTLAHGHKSVTNFQVKYIFLHVYFMFNFQNPTIMKVDSTSMDVNHVVCKNNCEMP